MKTELAKVIGMAAAAAALVPITLLRSDKWHFLGPAVAMPALIALSVTSLPQFLFSNRIKRELSRAAKRARSFGQQGELWLGPS